MRPAGNHLRKCIPISRIVLLFAAYRLQYPDNFLMRGKLSMQTALRRPYQKGFLPGRSLYPFRFQPSSSSRASYSSPVNMASCSKGPVVVFQLSSVTTSSVDPSVYSISNWHNSGVYRTTYNLPPSGHAGYTSRFPTELQPYSPLSAPKT